MTAAAPIGGRLPFLLLETASSGRRTGEVAFLDVQRSFRQGPAQAGHGNRIASVAGGLRRLSWGARTEARAVLLVEIGLTIALAVVAGRLFWTILAPLEGPSPGAVIPGASPAQADAVVAPGDPFRIAGVAAVELQEGPTLEEVAETSLNLTLHGTWTDEGGGSAVIATPDGLQKRYQAGETIVQDATLERIFRDQVTILRSGVRESLRMLNRQDPGSNAPARQGPTPPPASPQLRNVAPASVKMQELGFLGDQVLVMAQPRANGGIAVTLEPLGETEDFEALGLRSGDRLVAIAGAPVGADLLSDATRLAEAANLPQIEITVERNGQNVPVRIQLQDDGDGR